jgi:hypothetical protein
MNQRGASPEQCLTTLLPSAAFQLPGIDPTVAIRKNKTDSGHPVKAAVG